MIPDFPNEVNPNPVTAIDLLTEQGVKLRWSFDAPIQQSRMMMAIGGLFARLSEVMPEFSLPSEQEEFLSRPDRPSIVCLCGSTRFKEAFIFANFQLTMQGHIVLSVGWFSDEGEATHRLSQEEKTLVDALYMDKITLADEIFVLNVDGYIGESTANEIALAKKLGKSVLYLEAPVAAEEA